MNGLQNVTVPMETVVEVISMQLKEGGKAVLTVTGSSMEPMLRHGRDSVVLVPAEGTQKNGTVAFYRRPNGKYILHRIIAVTDDGYICCGDNQWQKEAVLQSQLIAAVDTFTRRGRTISVQDPVYRLYTGVWVGAFFLRPVYIFFRRRLARIYKKLRQGCRVSKSRREDMKHEE